jgi:outer membrane receptor for ferrienterochelin and colicins
MRKFFIYPVFLFSFYFASAQVDSVPKALKLSELSLETLMNINVITATGSEQKLSEAPATMNVITAKQIEERGYEQLEDALRDIPGIDFIHINGYAPTLIYFRGMYGAENLRALLMIDGIPENNIIGSNDIAGPAYSLHNVQRIEVIWGPASAIYGANAFGGVINIITKKGEDINGLHYEKGYGTYNTSFDKVMFGIKKSNWDVAIAGTLFSTDGPLFSNRDPIYTASYVNKAYSINGTISYATEKAKTIFGYREFNTPMGWGTILNSPTALLGLPSQGNGNKGVIGFLTRDINGEKSGLEDPYSRTAFIQNEYTPNKKFNLLTRIAYRETGIDDKSFAYIAVDAKKFYRLPTTSYSNRTSAAISANYSLNDNQQFSAGIDYYRDNVERGARKMNLDTSKVYLVDGRYQVTNLNATFKERLHDIRNNFGSYLQYLLNTNLFGKTSFTAGTRFDHNDYYGSRLSPRLAIVNKPDDKLTVKLLFGTAYRAPTNTEIYQAPPNVKVKAEKVRTYEVNLLYPFSTKFFAQLNVFHNEIRDAISLLLLADSTADKNRVQINTTGFEMRTDVVLSKGVSGFANFTYQNGISKNAITGVKRGTAGIAEVKGNAGIELLVDELLKVSIIENWVGQREVPRTDPYGPVGGYFVTNCVISTQKLLNQKIYASINIRNLFNRTYLDPGFRSADGILYPTVLEQPGRNILFKISVDF